MAALAKAAAPLPATTLFRIYRFSPEARGTAPFLEEFPLDTAKCGPMVLDALAHIKAHIDPTLSYRRACREGVCGSCALNINGRNGLACLTKVADVGPVVTVRPLPHFRVLRDLVVDMTKFFEHHASVRPWLERPAIEGGGAEPTKETIQTPHERQVLDGLYECIQCACCSGSCPEYWWSQDGDGRFLGPSALQQAYRWVVDSRDRDTAARLRDLRADHFKAYKCRTILNCTAACPKNLNPGRSVNNLRRLLDDAPRHDA
jgi:succinate dehydrogenase/fumarate reductase iron-sulfur protein